MPSFILAHQPTENENLIETWTFTSSIMTVSEWEQRKTEHAEDSSIGDLRELSEGVRILEYALSTKLELIERLGQRDIRSLDIYSAKGNTSGK